MKRVLVSGIQPTGSMHIGNYLGFVSTFVNYQTESKFEKRILMIADMHSLSTGLVNAEQLRANVFHTMAMLLSCGVDPKKTIIIQQSRLPEHTQLMWILGSAMTLPSLMATTQFRDKAKMFKDGSVPAGLATYPLLQAADVLVYKGTHVLVGEDQSQHMNIVRDSAEKFNSKVGHDYFPIPEKLLGEYPRLKSLRDPLKKMSKSDLTERSRINLVDTPGTVNERIRKALTDSNPRITYEPAERPGISNLILLYSALSKLSVDQVVQMSSDLDTLGFKDNLATLINQQLTPIRDQFERLIAEEGLLLSCLEAGEEQARPLVTECLQDVRRIIGML